MWPHRQHGQVLAAFRALRAQTGREVFRLAEVVEEVRRQGSELPESTIRTHISSRMCSNAPDHHGTVYGDLERVDHGEYRVRV